MISMKRAHALCLALLVATLFGCKGVKRGPTALPHFPDGAEGLRAFGSAVLDAARKDERDLVHDLLASTILTDAELDALLGAERAARLRVKYHGLMETMVNRGALELVAQIYDRKYDDVEVIADSDPALKAALGPAAPPIFALRFKKRGEDRGLRYDFFVYRAGRWATGNLLSKELVPTPTPTPTP
jgi:hypothetical protein